MASQLADYLEMTMAEYLELQLAVSKDWNLAARKAYWSVVRMVELTAEK